MIGDFIHKMEFANIDIEQRLTQILIDGQADNGNVKVVVDGNKVVRQILISPELFAKGDKKAIEDFTLIAMNIALKKAEQEYKEIVKGMAK